MSRRTVYVALTVLAAAVGTAIAAVANPLGDDTVVAPVVRPDSEAHRTGAVAQSECHLLGRAAHDAASFFAQRGTAISWRYTTFGSAASPADPRTGLRTVAGGRSTAPENVPGNSVVWDIRHEQIGSSPVVIVFVHAVDDPDAPRIVSSCR